MTRKMLLQAAAPQCARCPYALGLVKTLVSPCPQCGAFGGKPSAFPPRKP